MTGGTAMRTRSTMKRVSLFAAVTLVAGDAALAASDIISLNLRGSQSVFTDWGDEESAGIVDAADWNHSDEFGGQDLKYSDGAASTMDYSMSTNWFQYGTDADAFGTPNQRLMYGFYDNISTVSPWQETVTLSQIPFERYDVYVYVGNAVLGREFTVDLGGSPRYYVSSFVQGRFDEPLEEGFVEATSTTPGEYWPGNWVRFQQQTGASQTVYLLNTSADEGGRGGIFGLQVVSVPEPGAALGAFVALGCVAAIRRRSR